MKVIDVLKADFTCRNCDYLCKLVPYVCNCDVCLKVDDIVENEIRNELDNCNQVSSVSVPTFFLSKISNIYWTHYMTGLVSPAYLLDVLNCVYSSCYLTFPKEKSQLYVHIVFPNICVVKSRLKWNFICHKSNAISKVAFYLNFQDNQSYLHVVMVGIQYIEVAIRRRFMNESH